MSDSNLTSLYYAAETTFNETPDNSKTFAEVRFTGDTLEPEKGTLESAEIRDQRDLREIIKISESATGGFTAELVAGDYSPLIQATMMGTWATSTDSVTGTWATGGQTFTLDSGTFSAALQQARLIKVASAATSGHDGVHRIVSITATVITFQAGTVTASDAADAVDLTYNYVTNANTERSYLVEKKYESTASDFFLAFSGFTFNEMTLTAETEQAVIIGFNGFGERVNKGASTFGDGSPSSPSTNSIIETASGVDEILIAGTANTCVNRFEMTVNNNIRRQRALASLYSKGHGKGRFLVNGQIDIFFDNGTELTNFLNHTAQTMQIVMSDSAGNKFSFYMPSVQYTSGNAPTEAVDTDIIAPLGFSAQNGGSSANYALQVDYVAA